MADSPHAGQSQGEAGTSPEIIPVEGYRTSYPPVFAVAIVAALLVADYYFRRKLYPDTSVGLIDIVAALAIGAFWWTDSRRDLRAHLPKGWKAVIEPEELKFMSPRAFNRMRVKLIGSVKDSLDDHHVQRATRFSLDLLVAACGLAVLAILCLAGTLLWPTITIPAGPGELPQTYHTFRWGVGLAAFFALVSAWAAMDWHCRRLMQDQDYLYDLLEYPSWIPWVPERNNPIAMRTITRADPVETAWGKRCRHGTVKVYTWEGPEIGDVTYTFKRVPDHVEVCGNINAAVASVNRYQQMYP